MLDCEREAVTNGSCNKCTVTVVGSRSKHIMQLPPLLQIQLRTQVGLCDARFHMTGEYFGELCEVFPSYRFAVFRIAQTFQMYVLVASSSEGCG